MFKNREIKVALVKTPKQNASEPKEPRQQLDLDKINTLVQSQVKTVAIVLGAAYAAKKVLDTTSEIAIIVTRSHCK